MVFCGLFLVRVSLCFVARAVWHPAQWLKAVVSAAGIVIAKGVLSYCFAIAGARRAFIAANFVSWRDCECVGFHIVRCVWIS